MSQLPFDKIVLASHNKGKIAELKAMVEPLGLSVLSAADFALPEVVEDKDTFEGNAAKKALEICAAVNLPTLADDSGLCVDALEGGPGVQTARYSRTYERLMDEIKEVQTPERGAHFVCALAFAQPSSSLQLAPQLELFRGECAGHIHTEPLGEGGFGYDPVFIPQGESRTFAQMTPEEKKIHSHRGHAMQLFLSYLKAL